MIWIILGIIPLTVLWIMMLALQISDLGWRTASSAFGFSALLVLAAFPFGYGVSHASHCQVRPAPTYTPQVKAQPFVGGDYPDWNGFPIFHAPTTTTVECQ